MSLNLMHTVTHTVTNFSILAFGSCILQLVEALQLCQSPLDVFEPNTHHDKLFNTYSWFMHSTTGGSSAALSVITGCL